MFCGALAHFPSVHTALPLPANAGTISAKEPFSAQIWTHSDVGPDATALETVGTLPLVCFLQVAMMTVTVTVSDTAAVHCCALQLCCAHSTLDGWNGTWCFLRYKGWPSRF